MTLAAAVKHGAGVPTMAVGLIVSPSQAEEVLRDGSADLVALGREALADPRWPARAAMVLEDEGISEFQQWPRQYGWWLARRERVLAQLGISSVPRKGSTKIAA